MPKPILFFISQWQPISPCYGREIKGASVWIETKWWNWLVRDLTAIINQHIIIILAPGLSEHRAVTTLSVRVLFRSPLLLTPFRNTVTQIASSWNQQWEHLDCKHYLFYHHFPNDFGNFYFYAEICSTSFCIQQVNAIALQQRHPVAESTATLFS